MAREHGIRPHRIIGDLDSITPETRAWYEARGVPIVRETGQDDTDFEKALRHLSAVGARTVVAAGLTGLLLDHTLGNFSILQRYVGTFRLVLIDPAYRIDVITHTTRFASAPEERISIVPFPRATAVRYEGLVYPLDGADMEYGRMEGTCNEAIGEVFTVELRGGAVLVFRAIGVRV
jgi:thiamine pyrophosphokinase